MVLAAFSCTHSPSLLFLVTIAVSNLLSFPLRFGWTCALHLQSSLILRSLVQGSVESQLSASSCFWNLFAGNTVSAQPCYSQIPSTPHLQAVATLSLASTFVFRQTAPGCSCSFAFASSSLQADCLGAYDHEAVVFTGSVDGGKVGQKGLAARHIC